MRKARGVVARLERLTHTAFPPGFTVRCDLLPVVFSWQPLPGEQEGAKFHYEVQLRRASEYVQVSPVYPLVWEYTDDVM